MQATQSIIGRGGEEEEVGLYREHAFVTQEEEEEELLKHQQNNNCYNNERITVDAAYTHERGKLGSSGTENRA